MDLMKRKKRSAGRSARRPKHEVSPQQALVRALSHPVRVNALSILSERIASPKEIAEILDVPLPNVSYHVKVLDELGFVEVFEEETVRGAVAHFYKAIERSLIDNSVWKALDPQVRSAVSSQIIETLVADAAGSLAFGIFDDRDDRHLSRTALLLDEKGWSRVSRIQAKALEDILKEQVAAAARMNGSSAGSIHAIVGMFCFEAPPSAPAGAR